MNFTKALLVIAAITAAVMELIDISIVNVALSQMGGNLGASLEDVSWVITAYAIANVIIIPMTSFLAAKLGRRNYYIGSIIAFTFFSLMCGTATNIWVLVFFRFMQGIGGGALLSVSQVIVFEAFPKEKQNIASALFGIGVFTGPTIGPTLGGWITEHYSWPLIFNINLPIGIAVATVVFILLKEPATKPATPSIDWTGILLLIIGVGSLQTVLERGEVEDWFETKYITVLAITAVIGLSLFIWHELKTKHPVVDLRVLKSRQLSVAAMLTFVSGIGMFTSVYLTPVFAQRILGFPPFQTGMLLLPGAILAIFSLILSAILLKRGVPPHLVILIGFGFFICFSWTMSHMNTLASPSDFFAPLIFRAVGLALVTVPLTSLAVSGLAPQDIPQGAALNNMMRQLGGSFGIAMLNTYIHNRMSIHRSDLVSNITDYNPVALNNINNITNYFLSKGFNWQEAHMKALQLIELKVSKQTAALSYLDAYLAGGLVFLIALPLLLLVLKRNKKTAPVVVLSDH